MKKRYQIYEEYCFSEGQNLFWVKELKSGIDIVIGFKKTLEGAKKMLNKVIEDERKGLHSEIIEVDL